MLKLVFFLLQAAGGGEPAAGGEGGAGGAGGSPISTLIMFGGIIVVFYFFMIRPQQKRQKQESKFRESLEKGKRVVTIGGIHGKVVSVEDEYVLLEVDSGVKLRVKKAAISPEAVNSNEGSK